MREDGQYTAAEIAESLRDLVSVAAVFTSRRETVVRGSLLPGEHTTEREIYDRLASFEGRASIVSHGESVVIRLEKEGKSDRGKFPWINLGLFLLTLASTLLAGAFWNGGPWGSSPWKIFRYPAEIISGGAPFSISLLAILLFHEFGHYIAGKIHGVNVSLPYFIPAPPIFSPFGTLGALIISRSVFLNRRQLLDVGAAGPLAGLAVAIVVLVIGINASAVKPIPSESGFMLFGESMLFKFISYLVKGPIPDEGALFISSTAFAGWVGILVTMFNLLPLGQLDGGRIVYALIGNWQKVVSRLVIFGLLILSLYWPGWLLWMIIGLFLRPTHPPTVMDEIPLGRGRGLIGILSIVAFIVCFIPIPIRLG